MLRPEIECAAMDNGGKVFWYADDPTYNGEVWVWGEGSKGCWDDLLAIDTTGIIAELSLTKRPTN